MLSFVITLLVLVGLLILGIVYLAEKYGKAKTKLMVAKVQKKASDNAKQITRDIRNKSSNFIRGKLSKHWKK